MKYFRRRYRKGFVKNSVVELMSTVSITSVRARCLTLLFDLGQRVAQQIVIMRIVGPANGDRDRSMKDQLRNNGVKTHRS